MSKESSGSSKPDLKGTEEKSGVPFQALARAPGLIIRLALSALKFKRSVKKSARKMRRVLVKGGMTRDRAKELVCRYEEGLSIRKLINSNMGDSDFSSIPFLNKF